MIKDAFNALFLNFWCLLGVDWSLDLPLMNYLHFFSKVLKISLFQSKILFLGRAIFPQNWVQTQPNPSTIFGPMGFDSDGSKKIKRCSCNFHRNQDKKILLCTENELTSFGFGLFLALNMSFKELNAVSWNSIVF